MKSTTCVRLALAQKPKTVSASFPRRNGRRRVRGGGSDNKTLHVDGETYVLRESFYVNALNGWLSVYEHPLPLNAVTPLMSTATVLLPAPHSASLLVGTSVILVLGGVRGEPLSEFDVATYEKLMNMGKPPPPDAPLCVEDIIDEEERAGGSRK